MRNWCDSLNNNIDKIDIIGYFKFIRFLSRIYNDKSSTELEVIRQCQRFEDILSVRYMYKKVNINVISNDRRDIVEIIRSTIMNQKDLKRLDKLIKEDVDISAIASTGEVSIECMTRPAHINTERGMVINKSPGIILLNSLARYYLILRKFEFSPEAVEKFMPILKDNYVPMSLESYLLEKVGYHFKFNDDCWGTNIGTTISVVFYYVPTHPINPIIMFPVYGTGKGVVLNLFNREEDFGEYKRLIEVMFGVDIETMDPEKQMNFRSTRSLQQSNTTDVDNIVNNLMKAGMQKNYIHSDIVLKKGGHLGLNLIFNQMLNVLKGVDTLSADSFRQYEEEYLYKNSYRYITSSMTYEKIKELLNSYCQSQLRNLYYICSSYLECQKGIYIKDIEMIINTFNINNIWNVNDTLVDITDLTGISHWILFKYMKGEFMPIDLGTEDMRRIVVILNTLLYSPKIYYELTKHMTGFDDIVVSNLEAGVVNKYTIKLTRRDKELEITGPNIGIQLPVDDAIELRLKQEIDSEERTRLLKILHGQITPALKESSGVENLLIEDYNDIILINPVTAGVYIFNLEKRNFNNKYFKHPESLEVVSDTEDSMQIVLSNKVFEFNCSKDNKVQVMKEVDDVFKMGSNSLGFKSNLFDGDY